MQRVDIYHVCNKFVEPPNDNFRNIVQANYWVKLFNKSHMCKVLHKNNLTGKYSPVFYGKNEKKQN